MLIDASKSFDECVTRMQFRPRVTRNPGNIYTYIKFVNVKTFIPPKADEIAYLGRGKSKISRSTSIPLVVQALIKSFLRSLRSTWI